MLYDFAADGFDTKLYSGLFFERSALLEEKGHFAFLRGGLEATYVVHLTRLQSLLNFFAMVIWLRRYERKSIENRRFRMNGVCLAQNFRYKGLSPLFFVSRN